MEIVEKMDATGYFQTASISVVKICGYGVHHVQRGAPHDNLIESNISITIDFYKNRSKTSYISIYILYYMYWRSYSSIFVVTIL